MGRAIVRQPSAFLMDEPLSNLDAKLRVQMRAEISELQRNLGVTTLYVTHDQVEAMTMGDRVAVMRKGELQQAAEPQELYDHPVNLFVAGFIGSPPMNMFQAVVEGTPEGPALLVGAQRIVLDAAERAAHPGIDARGSGTVVVGIRPERLERAAAPERGRTLQGRVLVCEALGSDSLVHVAIPGSIPLSDAQLTIAHDVDDAVEAEELARDEHATLVARLDPRAGMSEGDEAELAIAPGSMLLYDAETGTAIS
jgi:multiple sugar transport system ATP-binding protein